MQKTSAGNKLLKFKLGIKVIAVLLLAVIVWYGQARVLKASRAVDLFQLAEVDTPPTNDLGDLDVACYNVAHARGPEIGADNWDGEKRADPLTHLYAIAAQIAESNASIVVLNEIDFNARWSDGIDQARIIAEQAGFPYLLTQRNFDVTLPFFTLQFGNAILSKFPIIDATFIKFPARSNKEDLFAGNHDGVVATVQLSDRADSRLRVVAVHLEYRDEATRMGAARMIADLAADDSAPPLIALGDFNSTPDGLPGHEIDGAGDNAITFLLDSGMKTLLPNNPTTNTHLTFPSTQPNRVIDWILVSPTLTLMERRTIDSDLSDHRMVVGVIKRFQVE